MSDNIMQTNYPDLNAKRETTSLSLPQNYAPCVETNVVRCEHGVKQTSYINPLFHFTSSDVSITAMEHNNHCKLLAIATSSRELYVVETQMMPVMEQTFATAANSVFDFTTSNKTCTPPFDRRLLDWNVKEMSTCIDTLPTVATQLNWGPWQYGVHLAVMCPMREIRLYRFSHAFWVLQARIANAAVLSFTFSPSFIITCACGEANVILYSQQTTEITQEITNHTFHEQDTTTQQPKLKNKYRKYENETIADGHLSNNVYFHLDHDDKLEKWVVCGRVDGISVNYTACHAEKRLQYDSTIHSNTNNNNNISSHNEQLSSLKQAIISEGYKCVSVDWDDSDTLLAAGYANGKVNIYKYNKLNNKSDPNTALTNYLSNKQSSINKKGCYIHTKADVNYATGHSFVFDLMFICEPTEIYNDQENVCKRENSIYTHIISNEINERVEDTCLQVSWAPSSGRSFLILSVIFTTHITLYFLRQSINPNEYASGKPQEEEEEEDVHREVNGEFLSPTQKQALRSQDRISNAAKINEEKANKLEPVSRIQMECIANCSVRCNDVLKLSWNNTGTRFVTAHYNNKLRLWDVHVKYRRSLEEFKHNVDDVDTVNDFNAKGHCRRKFAASIHEITQIEPYQATI